MNDRIEKWNARYAAGEGAHGFEPSSPLDLAVGMSPPGHALDIASGAGRHALYLAAHGWTVVALEGSQRGVDAARAEAERRGLLDRIDFRVVDLQTSARDRFFERDRYDVVCDFYYLDRGLFDDIRSAVSIAGLFVAAIHFDHPDADDPTKPSFILQPGELRATVDSWGWEVLHSSEGASRESGHNRPTAEIIARKPPV